MWVLLNQSVNNAIPDYQQTFSETWQNDAKDFLKVNVRMKRKF